VDWTEEDDAELAGHYARIGFVEGELWPAPPQEYTPGQILSLFRRIPDGAGRSGYMAALASAASSRGHDRGA